MANAVDKLFADVLPRLRPHTAEDWPEPNVLDNEPWLFEDKLDTPDDVVTRFEDEDRLDVTLEQLGMDDQWSEGVQSSDRDLIEGGLRHRGLDVLAFYKSRRLCNGRPFVGKWGIFYLLPGLQYLRSRIVAEYPGLKRPADIALGFLRAHEHFHFRGDLQTLMFEATLGHELYLPLRAALRARAIDFAEEALANRAAWDWAKQPSIGIQEFAFDFMKLQPGAYARFDERRSQLAAEWAGTAVDLRPPGSRVREDLAAWVEATPKGLMRPSLCPEYVVRPAKLQSWVSPVYVVPPVSDISDGADVVKALSGRYAQLREQWDDTKRKLKEDRYLGGLDFKPWREDGRGAYSVRVDRKFRAHMRHEGGGRWIAYRIGNHKDMGHG